MLSAAWESSLRVKEEGFGELATPTLLSSVQVLTSTLGPSWVARFPLRTYSAPRGGLGRAPVCETRSALNRWSSVC